MRLVVDSIRAFVLVELDCWPATMHAVSTTNGIIAIWTGKRMARKATSDLRQSLQPRFFLYDVDPSFPLR